MSYKRWAIAAGTAGVLLVMGCSNSPYNESKDADAKAEASKQAPPPANIDPKKGWVDIFPGDDFEVKMRCHGTRLIYVRDEIRSGPSVVDNAPECR